MWIPDEEIQAFKRKRIVDYAVEGMFMAKELEHLKSQDEPDLSKIDRMQEALDNCDFALEAACKAILL